MTNPETLRDMLPSQREDAQKEADAKARQIKQAQHAQMREDFTKTFQTQHGQRVLAWFFDRCGYDKPKLGANMQGLIDKEITTHNAMEEALYIAMRKYIAVDVLQQIEYGFVKPSGVIESTDDKPKKIKKTRKKG